MSYFQDRCHDRELVAAHEMTGPVEHFEIKWGKIYVVGVMCPPQVDWHRVATKSQWGQIPTVPICSAGPA